MRSYETQIQVNVIVRDAHSQCIAFMENDTAISKEGLLETVLPGSVTFESSILAPLRNSYLYGESKESFAYSSAQLIHNPALQKRFSDFHAEKRAKGYSEEELEESFGFLLLDDKSRANRLAETGLIVGQGTCTTLGDCSKGVYISKYSDCLDLKRWYDGKTGHIVLFKLRKGRVKEVTENYTQNFTTPTAGFDCHVSDQLTTVCAATSSFLAFERTQYYLYELLDGGEMVVSCPRHVCPFAIVAFSYGKTAFSLELKEKSHEKSTFHYQPWSGQLQIESLLYSIGLISFHGAMIPAKLPKTLTIDHAIRVSELRKALPQAVFETSPLGEVSLGGKWFTLYDVISTKARNDLACLTQELKEKDMALVVCLEDGGFFVLLHSSNFLSYEGAGTDKAFALQAMFIYPSSRNVSRETKGVYRKSTASTEVLQVLPALNYAELEMEKCSSTQHEDPLGTMEKHLQNFALIFPGLPSSPSREASMFPDQYDVPDGFPLTAPKWTEQTGYRLRTYIQSPHSFYIPVERALELLAAGKQQRSDDHDDDVFYYISSPEGSQTPAGMVLERDLPNETDHFTCENVADDVKKTDEQQAEPEKTAAAELSRCALTADISTPGAAVVAAPDNHPAERTHPSPMSGDLPTEHYAQNVDAVNTAEDSEKTPDKLRGGEFPEAFSKETVQTTSVALSPPEMGDDASPLVSDAEMMVDQSEKVDHLSDMLPKIRGQIPVTDKVLQEADLPTSISSPTTSLNGTEALTKGCKETQSEACSSVDAETNSVLHRRGRRRKRKSIKRITNTVSPVTRPLQNTTLSISPSTKDTPEQSSTVNTDAIDSSPRTLKTDWRSLPRRKKRWNADVSMKQSLRSHFKNTETPHAGNSETENNTSMSEISVKVNIMSSTPKQKREAVDMRTRYGLKTIITACGKVFVPHGSEVAPGDIKSNEKEQARVSSFVKSSSPLREKPTNTPAHDKPQMSEIENGGQHMPIKQIQNISVSPDNALSSEGDMTENDSLSPSNTEKASVTVSSEKNKRKVKGNVYRAISISKFKTVLKRANRTMSPGPQDHGKSLSANTEPELKRCKQNNEVVFSDKDDPLMHNPESAGSKEAAKDTPSEQSQRISKILKENGCNSIDSLSPNEEVKQANQQLESGTERKRISDGKSSKEEVAINVAAPSDALNLLADLALSVNSEEMFPKLGENHTGDKTHRSHQKVIHLIQDLNQGLNIPPKSPFPEGLAVTGDLIKEISKEHSYSQPTTQLSDSTGLCTQVRSDLILKLPDLSICPDNSNKDGWNCLASLNAPVPTAVKAKIWSSMFVRCRTITDKEGSIQVTRTWKENYDFKFDSKFTNDKLEKCVTRALHGKWDHSIDDNYEQVHLIFHMWIGLFYSNPTSRFFQFDNMSSIVERKNPVTVSLGAAQTSTPLPEVDSTSKDDKPTSLDPVSDALDLSVKAPWALDHSTAGENLTPSSGIQSRPEPMRENKMPAVEPRVIHSPNVLAGESVMDYTSTVESLEENAPSDPHDSSDKEEDMTTLTDGSYTEHLQSNSAYSQFCDHASNMKINEQNLLNVQKSKLMTDLPTSTTMNQKSAVVTDASAKNMAVFHKVVETVGPFILSDLHDSIPGRIKLLRNKFLSFKDKHKNESSVSVHRESISRDESSGAAVSEQKRESTPECVNSENEKACVLTAKTGISVPVSDENNVGNEGKGVPLTRHNKPAILPKDTSAYVDGNVPCGACNEPNDASDEVTSVVNIRDQFVDVLAEAKDKLDVVDDIPADIQDVNNTNEHAKPEFDMKTDMSADEQDVNNINKDAKTGLDVRDDTPANIQDVNVSTKDETKCQAPVIDRSSVDRHHEGDKTKDMAVHEEEHVYQKDKSNADEITNEGEIKVAELISELDSEEPNTVDEPQDLIDCVDTDVTDDPEDENQENVLEVTSGEILPEVLEGDTAVLEEGEINDDEHMLSSPKEDTTESVQSEMFDLSSTLRVSSTSRQLTVLTEDHSSPDTCIRICNDSESTAVPDTTVVQNEVSGIINPEPCEVKDSSIQGTAEAEDLAVLNANSCSGEDIRTLDKDSGDQTPLVPSICEKSTAEVVKMHESSVSMDASPPALQIDTEAVINSRCSTPTLDEPPCSRGSAEASNVEEMDIHDVSETEQYCGTKKSPNSTWLVLDSSEDSHSGSESPARREHILPQDPCRKTYDNATVEESVENIPFLTDEHVPEENMDYFDYQAIHRPGNTEELESQHGQFGDFSEQYDESYEELDSSWTHSTGFQTEGQKALNEWYAPEEDSYYTENISVHRDVSYRPRETTVSNSSDMSVSVQRINYSESSPSVHLSNERAVSFRRRAGLSKGNDEAESHESEFKHYSKKKHKTRHCRNNREEEEFDTTLDYSKQKTFPFSLDQSNISRTLTCSPYQRKEENRQPFDWRTYFKRASIYDSDEGNDGPFYETPSSIVTMLDKKGNRVIYESPSSTQKQLLGMPDKNVSAEEHSCTQSLIELEYLIFSEKMAHLLKNSKTSSTVKPQQRPNISPVENPMTIRFSRLHEQNRSTSNDQTWPTLSKFKINVDMAGKQGLKKTPNYSKPLHLQSLLCERGAEASSSKLSDITKECSKSYHTVMNDICVGKTAPRHKSKRKLDADHSKIGKPPGFCGRIKKDMFDHLHNNLNSVVRQACKTKYKFYILATSRDPFFEETKDLLEAAGHTAVEPYQFDFDSHEQTLLIILRNEDIAEHIFAVPHLLELKKSSRVLFAGIDQPDDVVNLTHQELFAKGGFVVFDETAMDTLCLDNMKKVVGIIEELDKKGKWKWFLHYRDSRKLRENARCSPEAQRRKQFIDCCQDAGIVEVLPYHDCDIISRDRPDYFRCLIRLQIQNISARFPIFITDLLDDTFEKNGILTMNIKTFSRILSNDTCSVS